MVRPEELNRDDGAASNSGEDGQSKHQESSWEDTFNWAKDEEEGGKGKSSSKTIYIIIAIVVVAIILFILYLYYNTSSKVDSVILDSINDPKNNLPVADIASPHPTTSSIPGSPQSPIVNVSPAPIYSARRSASRGGYRAPRIGSGQFGRPDIRPSPGGTSLISPNGRLYPAVENGMQTGWWLKPNSR